MIGEKVNNYIIESLLGEGGMGNVYMAKHESMDRRVAIKAILPELFTNEEIRQRFLNEAATMSKLQHTNIVAMYDYVSNDKGLFLIMEYVDGQPLSSYLQKMGGAIEEDLAIEITKQVVSACSHAHKNGVIHRDIKPANIMITNDGVVKILDFGIAKMMNEEVNKLTKTGTQLGTVHYMSPEQVKGEKITPGTDIYAIGVTLFQMVTGSKPYEGLTTEYQIYDKIVKEPLPDARSINSELTEFIQKVIVKSTRKEAENRFRDCAQFLVVLSDKASYMAKKSEPKQPVAKVPPTEVQKAPITNIKSVAPKSGSNSWMGYAALGLAVLLILFMIAYVMDPWMINVSAYSNVVIIIVLLGAASITIGILAIVKGVKMLEKGTGVGAITFAFLAMVMLDFVDYSDVDYSDDYEDALRELEQLMEGDLYEEEASSLNNWSSDDMDKAKAYADFSHSLYPADTASASLVLDGYIECFINDLESSYSSWDQVPESVKEERVQYCHGIYY